MIDELLSQDEINALLQGHSLKEEESSLSGVSSEQQQIFNDITNIFATAITNVFGMLAGRDVNVPDKKQETIPQKDIVLKPGESAFSFHITCQGMSDAPLTFITTQQGALILADLMMGGEGKDLPEEASELYLNAAQEGLSQMVGASLTNMSGILGGRRLLPDNVQSALESGEWLPFAEMGPDEKIWSVEMSIKIDDVAVFPLWVVFPLDVVNKIADEALEIMKAKSAPEPEKKDSSPAPSASRAQNKGQVEIPVQPMENNANKQRSAATQPVSQVDVRPAQFMPLSQSGGSQGSGNIDLIADIPVRVTVELGRTRKSISEILNMTPGSVIELDKMAGEPVDILVNSKLVARGEVVVIDENFGVRITEIVNSSAKFRS
ncbi:MAG: flagellar motor switch phosphatase FliY [Aminobacterium sp.]|jgi:flagellar motor switch protein FliN/FliY|uniref:flagellar motor switch phosphatase FliY n=1 Tax=Aminobacterium sp. TaxID=1872491 RepID=UPI001BD02485|nr:flagellar motor switch phosphatase FliY [Aminobacterium sp.]MDD2207077.1 flagellar motor switch phosphatase FliY [Aminobacterium sp.]MDD3425605.1 flagellar motor switch phosphatase FliY [Aminobacterium sp.]MDD3707438.1 flagellar motor switch phosphatase FliY [Aminobacterium sp.]MDD4228780.1 flagellar motor switch phosphatase FliY [Aminobacterium sp.]MDD4550601.1 flagellar motor switch phosphatase FliY [Aminobacterium sp.]